MITSLGIGSGVLTSDLLEKLVEAERAPTELRLTRREDDVNAKISEFGKIQSLITELRLPARTLGDPKALQSLSATSSNSAVTATVTSNSASKGQFTLDVTEIATSRSIATGTFADKDVTAVGSGTLALKVGSVTKNITIDSSNNTLSGVASEINKANIGATASVVDTGAGFRLVISSEKTGVAEAVEITVTDTDGNSGDAIGLSQLAFDGTVQNLTETVVAKDAAFSVNGIAVTRSSNEITDVIAGVTLQLTAKSNGSPSVVKVTQDTEGVADRVQAFVDKFNELQGLINETTKFDPATGTGGIFLGDAAVRQISQQLKTVLSQVIPGLQQASVRTVSEAGIASNAQTGLLEFDRTKFTDQLTKNTADVVALFAEQGRASDSQVTFLTASVNTKPGTYAVNITQAATQGAIAGTLGLAGPITIDADNDNLSFKVNGSVDVAITLTQAVYATPQDLVTEIQAQLSANSSLVSAGLTVQVGLDASNQLTFTSGTFGSSSKVDVTAVDTNTATSLGLAVAGGTAGVDVAGTINGKAATGKGQTLTAASGDNSSGIAIQISGATLGNRGDVTYIQGVGDRLVDLINGLLAADGAVTSRNTFFQTQLTEIADQRAQLDTRIESSRQRLAAQFLAADQAVSRFNNTLQFLAQNFSTATSSSSGG